MAVCEECGSHRVAMADVDGARIDVCDLCGHLQGEGPQVALLRERQEAEERGFDPRIYPLVKALEGVPNFRVDSASAGRPDRAEYPFVFLRVAGDGLRDLERLLTSLEMANKDTKRRWVVELSLQRGLLFILRPRFWKAILDITAEDIREARSDLPVLAQVIRRDVKLGWWGGA
ncbi:MAG: hypothetical protein ACYTG6_01330 [Planctomycetota bacterium]|jgi:hypothetical protein